jgi:hypothetical protein
MKKIITTLVITTAAMICALPAMAQQTKVNSTGGNSPHETTSATIGGRGGPRITITYGRPYAKGRVIWGTLVPWNQPWRLGSDEATLLIVQKPIEIGGTNLPAGAYTLYMIPSESGTSQLVISKGLGGWGIPVDTAHDYAKVDLTKATLDAPVDEFTMTVAQNPAGGGILKLSWEKTAYSVAFTIAK